jgi:hypothetical protein
VTRVDNYFAFAAGITVSASMNLLTGMRRSQITWMRLAAAAFFGLSSYLLVDATFRSERAAGSRELLKLPPEGAQLRQTYRIGWRQKLGAVLGFFGMVCLIADIWLGSDS